MLDNNLIWIIFAVVGYSSYLVMNLYLPSELLVYLFGWNIISIFLQNVAIFRCEIPALWNTYILWNQYISAVLITYPVEYGVSERKYELRRGWSRLDP